LGNAIPPLPSQWSVEENSVYDRVASGVAGHLNLDMTLYIPYPVDAVHKRRETLC